MKVNHYDYNWNGHKCSALVNLTNTFCGFEIQTTLLLLTSLTLMRWLYFWERPWHALMFDRKGGVPFLNKKVNSLPFEKVRKASEHKVQHVKHWAEQFYAIQDVRDTRQADASEWPCPLTSDRHWRWKSHTEGLRGTFYDAHQSNEQPWGYCTVYGWPRPDLHLIRKGTTIPFSPPPPPSLTETHSFPIGTSVFT